MVGKEEDTFDLVKAVYGKSAMKKSSGFKWQKKFKDGR